MARMMEGQKPVGNGWQFITSIGEWLYFEQPQAHSTEWITCKLVADGKVERKANYWFTRNKITKAMGFSRDLMLLKDHRPALFEKFMGHLNKTV